MELLRRSKIDRVDFLRESLQKLVQALMELEVAQHLHGFGAFARSYLEDEH